MRDLCIICAPMCRATTDTPVFLLRCCFTVHRFTDHLGLRACIVVCRPVFAELYTWGCHKGKSETSHRKHWKSPVVMLTEAKIGVFQTCENAGHYVRTGTENKISRWQCWPYSSSSKGTASVSKEEMARSILKHKRWYRYAYIACHLLTNACKCSIGLFRLLPLVWTWQKYKAGRVYMILEVAPNPLVTPPQCS